MNLSDCYKILEVEPTCSDRELHEAYKLLVKVWHPDRYNNDPSVKRKAEQKLKEINAAYDTVRAARKVGRGQGATSTPSGGTRAPSPEPPRGGAGPGRGRAGGARTGAGRSYNTGGGGRDARTQPPPRRPTPPPPHQRKNPPRDLSGVWHWMMIFLLVGAYRVCKVAWDGMNPPETPTVTERTVPQSRGQSSAPATSVKRTTMVTIRSNVAGDRVFIDGKNFGSTPVRVRLTVGTHLVAVTKSGFKPVEGWVEVRSGSENTCWAILKPTQDATGRGGGAGTADRDATGAPRGRTEKHAPKNRNESSRTSDDVRFPGITLGLSRKDVVSLLGQPTDESRDELVYGHSKLFFDEGRVVGWINSGSPALPVHVAGERDTPSRSCIGSGSPLSDLAALMGPPNAIIGDKWYYGLCYARVNGPEVIEVAEVSGCRIPVCR